MKKLMKKKINVFGKEISVFMIALIGAMVLVSAALIPYFGLITGTVTVNQSLTIDQPSNWFSFNTTAGDGYGLYLLSGENHLNRNVSVMGEMILQKKNETTNKWVNLTDDTGIDIGVTGDVKNAYNTTNNCSNWTCAKTWLMNNTNSTTWILTQLYAGNYSTSIIGLGPYHGYHPYYTFGSNGVLNQTQIISPGKFYEAFYIGTNVALVPGKYRLKVEMLPA